MEFRLISNEEARNVSGGMASIRGALAVAKVIARPATTPFGAIARQVNIATATYSGATISAGAEGNVDGENNETNESSE